MVKLTFDCDNCDNTHEVDNVRTIGKKSLSKELRIIRWTPVSMNGRLRVLCPECSIEFEELKGRHKREQNNFIRRS